MPVPPMPSGRDDVELLDHRGTSVRVIRSVKRRKTSSARMIDGVVEVRVPAWLDSVERRRTVVELVDRVTRVAARRDDQVDLFARACEVASRYDLPRPTECRWVDNQTRRWASCTPSSGVIRVSSRLRPVPTWVLDAVLVHELAHLVEPGHGPAFKAIEDRYPLRERADGFLEAMSLGLADEGYRS